MSLLSRRPRFRWMATMSEITSGSNLTVMVLDDVEAIQLFDLLNSHPTLNEDYPILVGMIDGLTEGGKDA
jgi:hypothetical protein